MNGIRPATAVDLEAIRDVILCAFPESESEAVATLAVDLLCLQTSPGTLVLVAEVDDTVAGHIAFSPVTIEGDQNLLACILAPLAVKPKFQKHGLGSQLVRSGIEHLSHNGSDIVFVYGDPAYYGKFGFDSNAASGFLPPCALTYPFGWQAILLNEEVKVGSPRKVLCVEPLNKPEMW